MVFIPSDLIQETDLGLRQNTHQTGTDLVGLIGPSPTVTLVSNRHRNYEAVVEPILSPADLKVVLAFVPIVEIANGTVGVLVTPSLPVKTVQELIALAKSKPGQLSYASSGFGGLIHLNYEMLKQMTGAEMTHVPYKGTSFFQADLYENRVQVSIDNVLAHLPHIASGKVRVLAVTSKARSPLLPEVPTMAEAGVPGFESATNYTLFVPKGTPADVVAKLNAAGNEAIKDADFRERMLKLGIVPVASSTQAEAQAKMASEMKRWGDVIQKGNIKPS